MFRNPESENIVARIAKDIDINYISVTIKQLSVTVIPEAM